MVLKPLIWNGYNYTLSIQRHWNVFFGLATMFEINGPRMTKLLPEAAGRHITEIHELVETSREYFDAPENWWSFSCKLCDQYCDYYVMKRSLANNTFAEFHSTYMNDRAAVQNFAKASRGYIGPDKWELP